MKNAAQMMTVSELSIYKQVKKRKNGMLYACLFVKNEIYQIGHQGALTQVDFLVWEVGFSHQGRTTSNDP